MRFSLLSITVTSILALHAFSAPIPEPAGLSPLAMPLAPSEILNLKVAKRSFPSSSSTSPLDYLMMIRGEYQRRRSGDIGV